MKKFQGLLHNTSNEKVQRANSYVSAVEIGQNLTISLSIFNSRTIKMFFYQQLSSVYCITSHVPLFIVYK